MKKQTALAAACLALLVAAFVLGYREPARDPDAQRRVAFENIYAHAGWGRDKQGRANSGPGSTLEFTRLYRAFLQDFLAANQIRSVVDAGCGDWEFSQALDWAGIDYLGIDIVASVIEQNRQRYGAPNVRFAVADIVRDELPPADLLIVKDVLMHLPDADISRFLRQLQRYRHVLIVNDVDPVTLSAEPSDTGPGGFRRIDLTRPPHSLPATKVFAWRHGGATKLVLHIRQR